MRKINNEEFNVLTKKEGIVLIDFYANWCGPCKMLTPVLEQFAEKTAGEVEIYKVDVDENPELCGQFNISSIPTLLFFPFFFLFLNVLLVSLSIFQRA